MKRALFVFVVVLVGFMASACATGGAYVGARPFPGPLGDVVAGNLGLTCPGDVFIGAPVNRCLGELGGNASRYAGYPMYRGGMGGPQLSQADKLAIFCGLGGSGVAMIMNVGFKRIVGAGLVSAASCEVAGAIMARRGSNNQQRDNGVIVTPPSPSPGQGRRIASDGTPVAVGTRPGVRPIIENRFGEFTLSNSTRFKMDVYDGETGKEENFLFRLLPGEKRGVDAPEDRYRGLALVPNIHGNISTEEFGVSPTDSGWIFVEPDVMKKGR